MSALIPLSIRPSQVHWPEPGATWLVLLENPAHGLAAALGAGEADDPAGWLNAWCVGATRVLRQVQRDPTRCVLLDADEVRSFPELFLATCLARFGVSVELPVHSPVVVDPLSLALGNALAHADRDLQALYVELQASCALLDSTRLTPPALHTGLNIDGAAAAAYLRELHSAAQQAAQLGAVCDQRDDALHERNVTVQENALLQLQLSQVLEEIEHLGRRCQALEDAAQELAALRDVAAQSEAASQLDRAELAKAQATAVRQTEELTAVSEEYELLVLQLRQAQEELEHCYLKSRQLEGQALFHSSAAWHLGLSIEYVQAITERNATPHRELGFTLHRMTIDGRQIDQATVRLVEHHGHPGLVIFGQAHDPQLLQCWRETGREDGDPYALLVPDDTNSQPLLDAMGTTDWLLINALAAALEKRLDDDTLPVAPHWRQVARRLREQLQELPARFRYSTLAVQPADGSPSGGWEFCFGGVSSGMRRLERLVVQWWPSGPQAGLELLCDADAGPPLSAWPSDEQGVAIDRLRLPSGSGADKQARRQCLARMTPADRGFVLTLLAAWPQVVAQLPPSLLDGPWDATALAAAATSLLEEARKSTPERAQGGLGGLLDRLSS